MKQVTSPATQPPQADTFTRTSVTPKAANFLRHLKRKDQIAQVLSEAGYTGAGKSMRDCHTTEHLCGCSACGHKFWVISKCRQRLCPICSYKVTQQRTAIIESFLSSLRYPKFITLTMPRWKDEPRDGITFIRNCFHRLRRNKRLPGFDGGVYAIEVVPKNDGWHIHIHLIVSAKFIPHRMLQAAWGTIIGTYQPSVDIRHAQGKSTAKYIAKYVSKSLSPSGDPSHYARLYAAIHGSRLFSLFGSWFHRQDYRDTLRPVDTLPALQCPKCGTEGSLFDVRTGFFQYGKYWEMIEDLWTINGRSTRPRAGPYGDPSAFELDKLSNSF